MGEAFSQHLAEWDTADERLCRLVMGAPEVYEECLLAVSRIVQQLQACRTPDELVANYPEGPALADAAIPAVGVPRHILVGVACNVRHRQLAAEARAQGIRRRIDEARAAGRAWVTLTDDPLPEPPLVRSYEQIQMRLADGMALRASVDLDPDTYEPVYGVEVVCLDPWDGRPRAEDPASAARFHDRAEWEAAIEAARAGLDAVTVPVPPHPDTHAPQELG